MKHRNKISLHIYGITVMMLALVFPSPPQSAAAETKALVVLNDNKTESLIVRGGEETSVNDDGIRVGPNPFTPNNNGFNDFVTFDFSRADAGANFIVRIFDMNGKRIRTLRSHGRSEIIWNGSDGSGTVLKPGIYLYIIETNSTVVRRGSVTLAL